MLPAPSSKELLALKDQSQGWWHTPIIPAPRQDDLEFEPRLGYIKQKQKV
jgi:hypothetical protein